MQRTSYQELEKRLCDEGELARSQIVRLQSKIANLQSMFSESTVKYNMMLRAPQGDQAYVNYLKKTKAELDNIRGQLTKHRNSKAEIETVLAQINREMADVHTTLINEKISAAEFTKLSQHLMLTLDADSQLSANTKIVVSFLQNQDLADDARVLHLTGWIQVSLLLLDSNNPLYTALKQTLQNSVIDDQLALKTYTELWLDHMDELPSITRESDQAIVEENGNQLLQALAADTTLPEETKTIIVEATNELMIKPNDVTTHEKLEKVIEDNKQHKINLPAVIAGGILSLLAAATIAVSIAFGIVTLGMSAPIVIAGIAIGGFMMASGITMMLPPVNHSRLFQPGFCRKKRNEAIENSPLIQEHGM